MPEPIASTIQRAPSPSDAALVKPAVKPTETFPQDQLRENYVPPPDISMYRWNGLHATTTQQPTGYIDSTGAYQNSPYRAQNTGNTGLGPSEWENNFVTIPRYTDGPFVPWNENNIAQRSMQPFIPYQDNGAQQTDDWVAKPFWKDGVRDIGSHPQPRVPLADLIHSPSMVVEEPEEQAQPKPSRLPISDIVNSSSNPDVIRPRISKRKVDEMLSSDAETAAAADFQDENLSQSTQRPVLPDAQPRDEVLGSRSTSQETSLSTLCQLSEPRPSLELCGSARKKLKVSPKASRSVKAFVSGVLVGAISLAGACVAFVATIPETVKNDALRDFI